jgi:small subunit ribosomal protein S18
MPSGRKRAKPREGGPAGEGGKGRRTSGRPKSCFFCRSKIESIDYKNVAQLRRFISERGKIRGRGQTGSCRKHQSQVATAIKRAREMALLPYVAESAPPADRSRSHAPRRHEHTTAAEDSGAPAEEAPGADVRGGGVQ